MVSGGCSEGPKAEMIGTPDENHQWSRHINGFGKETGGSKEERTPNEKMVSRCGNGFERDEADMLEEKSSVQRRDWRKVVDQAKVLHGPLRRICTEYVCISHEI